MIEKLYTVEEVAKLASVTGRTIRNYLKSGRLVGRKIGGQWRFPENEVQRLLTGAPLEPMDEPAPVQAAAHPEPVDDSHWADEDERQDDAFDAYPGEVPEEAPSAVRYPAAERAPAPLPQPSAPPPPLRHVPPAPLPTQAAPPAPVPAQAAPLPTPSPAVIQPAVPVQPAAAIQQAAAVQAPPVSVPVAPQALPYAAAPPVAQPLQAALGPGGEVLYYAVIPSQIPGGAPSVYPLAVPAAQPQGAQAPAPPAPAAPLPTPQPPPPPPQAPADKSAENTDNSGAEKQAETPPAPEAAPSGPQPELSDVGKRVSRYISEVHDCSAGPQICSIIDLYQSIAAARVTSDRLSQIAEEESAGGLLCQSFVEYDERFFMARYTLFGTSAFLMRGLKLIG